MYIFKDYKEKTYETEDLFLNDRPYIRKVKTEKGEEVDFCLGSNEEEAGMICRKIIKNQI